MSDNETTKQPCCDNLGSKDFAYVGVVKWFNNRAGYGFVTVLNGDKKDTDVFVHHSGVTVNKEQYRYLVQGEYVSFGMTRSNSKDHKWQATDVRGILRNKLMCETHWDMRKEREERGRGNEASHRPNMGGRGRRQERPQRYGGGPREDAEGFTLSQKGHHVSHSPKTPNENCSQND